MAEKLLDAAFLCPAGDAVFFLTDQYVVVDYAQGSTGRVRDGADGLDAFAPGLASGFPRDFAPPGPNLFLLAGPTARPSATSNPVPSRTQVGQEPQRCEDSSTTVGMSATLRVIQRWAPTAQRSGWLRESKSGSETMRETEVALTAYLRIKGQKQGEMKGSATQKGHERKIVVLAMHHEIISPRDASSGQSTGKRIHKPLVITKELDQSTPQLYNALVNNEKLTEWELQFWRPVATGKEEPQYSVKLTDANITSIEFGQPSDKNPDLANYTVRENVAFTYRKIEWTWVKGGIMAMDDWNTSVA